MEKLKTLKGAFFIYLLAFFLLPILDLYVLKLTQDGFAMVIIYLLYVNSAAVLLVSGYENFRYGWKNSYHFILMAVMYSISCFVLYNSSALMYLVWYLLVAVVGSLAGFLVRKGWNYWQENK